MMTTVGSDWSLALPRGTLRPAAVERLPAVSEAFGLSPHRPDGKINGFAASPGREGEHRVLDRRQVVPGLATGTWCTNLLNRADVFLSAGPRDDSDFVSLSLDSVHCRRVPDAAASRSGNSTGCSPTCGRRWRARPAPCSAGSRTSGRRSRSGPNWTTRPRSTR